MRKLLFGILFYLIIHAPAFAETSLWKVQSDNSIAYLDGTCHILRQSDYPLPKEFDIAYGDADVIIPLVVDRNQNWLPKIEGYLQTSQREFVLVGVGHLVGEEGIIEQLKKHGYQVEKLSYKE